jgi:cytosine permease
LFGGADKAATGGRWAGPRSGFNPAGWFSWLVGFAVGGFNLVAGNISALQPYAGIIPIPPLSAFIVGFVLYVVFAKMGMESATLAMPETVEQKVGV